MVELEPLAKSILDFWCGDLDEGGSASPEKKLRWFKKDPEFDDSIKRLYSSYLETAFMGAYDRWTETLGGTAAAIILMDQFPRNIYRGSPKSWQWDKKAIALSLMAIDKGDHLKAPASWAYFIMMPTMHSESLDFQEIGVRGFTTLAEQHKGEAKTTFENALGYAISHRDIVARFGRFPHRNDILGRESTTEEIDFLKEPGSSF